MSQVKAPAEPSWWRRNRATTAIAAGFLAAIAVVVWANSGPRTSTPLDPDNPGGNGTRALAQVLRDRGVEVTVVRSADALDDVPLGADTTVVVTSANNLGPSTLERLQRHQGESLVVVVSPGPGLADALSAPGGSSENLPGAVSADCDSPVVRDRFDGLRLDVATTVAYPGPGCFAAGEGSALFVEDPTTWLWGADRALTNDHILTGDNAAISLRLLGSREHLVWYVPDVRDLDGDQGVSLRSLLPAWIVPALLLTAIAVITVMWWRGRRLGPLATEPLPVIVKAIETTQSQGRLYRRAGDREHTATALRAATRQRCAVLLSLGATDADDLDRISVRIADRLGVPAAQVRTLLGPNPVRTDADLVSLAQDLSRLEEEVRHR